MPTIQSYVDEKNATFQSHQIPVTWDVRDMSDETTVRQMRLPFIIISRWKLAVLCAVCSATGATMVWIAELFQ